jgi:CubicO group peptidase (beta-lactamase class C family)
MEILKRKSGIIYAKPDKIASNIPLDEVLRISAYFNRPENAVQIQFASAETQYVWQNWSQFYRTALLYRKGKVAELPYNIQNNIGNIAFIGRDGIKETVNAHFEKCAIDAMVVVKDGAVVYERYKTMQPDDKHIWFSISKIVGATMLAFLEYEGKIDVKQPVSYYLNELSSTVWDTVTVEETMDMATGLNGTEHDEPDRDSRINQHQIWYRWAATTDVGIFPTNETSTSYNILGEMKRRKPSYEAFEYNSINTFIANRIVEKVGDSPLYQQISERMWSKLGMEHDGAITVSPGGKSLGFMGVNSSLRDLARFGMAYTPSCANIAGEAIIPRAILDKIQNTSHAHMFNKGYVGKKMQDNFPDVSGIANRYQWDAVFPDGDFFKGGVGGQGLYISPYNNTIVAWFGTSDGKNKEESMARSIVEWLSRQ